MQAGTAHFPAWSHYLLLLLCCHFSSDSGRWAGRQPVVAGGKSFLAASWPAWQWYRLPPSPKLPDVSSLTPLPAPHPHSSMPLSHPSARPHCPTLHTHSCPSSSPQCLEGGKGRRGKGCVWWSFALESPTIDTPLTNSLSCKIFVEKDTLKSPDEGKMTYFSYVQPLLKTGAHVTPVEWEPLHLTPSEYCENPGITGFSAYQDQSLGRNS